MTQLKNKLNTLSINYSTNFQGLIGNGKDERFLWNCSVTYNGNTISSTMKLGIAHVKIPHFVKSTVAKNDQHRHYMSKPIPPPLEDFIYCLCVDSSCANETFEDWCNSFGYDTDSRSALDTYLKCQKTLNEMRKVFGYNLTEELIGLEY